MKKAFLFAVVCVVALLVAPVRLMAVPGSWFPDWGADAATDLYAPNLAGPGGFVTTTGGAPASALNPAQGGTAQRIVFDAGFLALTGLGNPEGFGSVMEVGAMFPTRYGVFGGSFRYIDSPFDEHFPIRRTFSGNLNAAKEIYTGMSVGAGLNFGFGHDWTLSGDLGFHWNMGYVGPLGNFTLGATLGSLGKSWTPTWLTPAVGLSADLIRVRGKDGRSDPFALVSQADLSFPSAFYINRTSLIFKAGLRAEIADIVRISLSWPGGSGMNARELAEEGKDKFNPIPSVGLGINIVLPSGGERIAGGRLPSDGDLAIDLAFKPLYKGVVALGGGATWTVGIADKRPPVISLDYPEPESAAYPMHFSPNNDGASDYLEFPVSLTDERYIENWTFEIFSEEGELVRSYKNKELRPENQGVRNFFSRLFAVKQHVEVPPTLTWDGILDSGEMAPDGMYYFVVSAADDSGNRSITNSYWAVLDSTAPTVAIEPMNDEQRVFSPGGGGAKNTITIRQNGSSEEAWQSGIYNTAGDVVRTFEPENGNPRPRTWDGRNDSGDIAPDGAYTYRVSATDRAQNSASAVLANIIVNTIRPEVNLVIADPWFSPNNDGMKDTVIMNLTVPAKGEVTSWTIRIKDSRETVRRTITGGQAGGIGSVWNADGSPVNPPPDRLEYDGRDERNLILEEGQYQAELSVRYLNGFTSTALSPNFFLDVSPPLARVSSEYVAFSPTHGGVQSEMSIKQEGSQELVWTGDVRRATGTPGERAVRSFRFSGVPPAEVRWDGHGESGTFAADGEYTYELYATDQAGNTGRSNQLRFRLSTVDTPVMITTDSRAFSPSGNSPRTSINLNPRIQVSQGVVSYKVDILDSRGAIVRTFEGRGVPPGSVNWNGRNTANALAPEGSYTARLELRYEQGNQPTATSLPFGLDITPPRGTASAPYTVFSPTGRRSTLPLSVTTEANDEWQAAIVGANGRAVRTWEWRGAAPQIVWDGKDAAGNAAPDGTYQFTLQSTDEAGNTARAAIPNLVLDARVPRLILTASAEAIAPRPNQSSDLVRFGIINSLADGVENWNLELKDSRGTVLRRFSSQAPAAAGGRVAPPPANIGWNGLSDAGAVREGLYTPTLTVNYLKGDTVTAEAAPILVNVTGPQLSFSYRPEYFSPDNDGVEDELFMNLAARSPSPIDSWSLEIREPEPPFQVFYRIAGRGSPAEIVRWDGRSNRGELVQAATDYPVRFSATDNLGNSSTIEARIGIDVLVIRDGDRLRIQVPSIVFRENAADFNGIPDDRLTNNRRVLRRIAEILNKFRDYRILVEGHANPVLLTSVEEREELQPLSEARARAVMNMLIEFGVARARLSSVGMGGTRTVVAHADRDNWWKNRRVEFILIK